MIVTIQVITFESFYQLPFEAVSFIIIFIFHFSIFLHRVVITSPTCVISSYRLSSLLQCPSGLIRFILLFALILFTIIFFLLRRFKPHFVLLPTIGNEFPPGCFLSLIEYGVCFVAITKAHSRAIKPGTHWRSIFCLGDVCSFHIFPVEDPSVSLVRLQTHAFFPFSQMMRGKIWAKSSSTVSCVLSLVGISSLVFILPFFLTSRPMRGLLLHVHSCRFCPAFLQN